MVFSFFKKQPEKMPERATAKPKPPAAPSQPMPRPAAAPKPQTPAEPAPKIIENLPELEFTRSIPGGLKVEPMAPPAKPIKAPAPQPALDDEGFELDFTISEFDRNYSESSVMGINVDHDVDSMQADIEQVAVLYSNGHDSAARSLLEAFVKFYRNVDGLRIWQMLFDLLQLTGDRAAFDKLGMDFAETCETSAPTWRNLAPVAGPASLGVRSFALQGVLTADSIQALAPLNLSLTDKRPVRIDCSKLVGCDDEVAGQFASQLLDARRKDVAVILEQIENFIPRLRSRLVVGEKKHARVWLLALELLQRYSSQEQFEECAIDFAVTFERSPPSWEVVKEAIVPNADMNATRDPRDAYYLAGDIKNAHFDELPTILELMDNPVLDFSGVRRLDFFSAGQLANRIAPLKDAGRDIVIRSPNHLVAELMGVVGLNKVARIIVLKT